jgi:hypothetical protein
MVPSALEGSEHRAGGLSARSSRGQSWRAAGSGGCLPTASDALPEAEETDISAGRRWAPCAPVTQPSRRRSPGPTTSSRTWWRRGSGGGGVQWAGGHAGRKTGRQCAGVAGLLCRNWMKPGSV